MGQEVGHVLEVIRAGVGCQHLHGAQRLTVARENISDLALRDGHQWGDVHIILNGHQEVQTTTEHVGLIAGFAIQGNEARF